MDSKEGQTQNTVLDIFMLTLVTSTIDLFWKPNQKQINIIIKIYVYPKLIIVMTNKKISVRFSDGKGE